MKRILFVGPYPPPYGGISSHLHDLLPKLSECGYEVVSLTTGAKDNILQSSGMKNIYIDTTIRKKYLLYNIIQIVIDAIKFINIKKDLSLKQFIKNIILSKRIEEIHKQERIDVVIFYEKIGELIPIYRKLIGGEAPIVLMFFGEYYLDSIEYKKISRYMKSVFECCNHIMSSSKYCADSILTIFQYNYPVDVIYVGVDRSIDIPTSGVSVRNEFDIPSSAVLLLFLGRMHKSMGLDFLLKIAPKLLDIGEDVYLLIAGAKGDLSYEVGELAKKHPRIKFGTDIPFEKKPDFYAACDVFLAPTMEKHACMGVSIKEAMACGKPIIASNSGGIPEAIEDGVNGFLVPFTGGQLDETIFIERAKQLVSDSLLRKNMGTAGRQKVMRLFTNDETTRRYLEIIKTLEQGAVSSRL